MDSGGDVLEDMKTAEGEESENGDGPRVKRTWQSPPTTGFVQMMVYDAYEIRAEATRL